VAGVKFRHRRRRSTPTSAVEKHSDMTLLGLVGTNPTIGAR
jgi:hypothetical protein